MSGIEDARTTIEYISKSINRLAAAINAPLLDDGVGMACMYESALIYAAAQELRGIGEKLYVPNVSIEKLDAQLRETKPVSMSRELAENALRNPTQYVSAKLRRGQGVMAMDKPKFAEVLSVQLKEQLRSFYAGELTDNETGERLELPEKYPPLFDEAKSSVPERCDECTSFSGDGMNDCCKHPSYVDDGFNMNARPGRVRMAGCPLEVRGDEHS